MSVTGNLSAVKFIGDGSALTGLTTSGDRIVSGTSSIIVSESGHISFTTAGTERMVINASGNVGIGTSAPKAMVEIVSATDGAALLKLSSERAWCFRQNGTGATAALELRSLGNSQTHDCSAAVSNKNLVFNTTGNVGIGTTSPGKVLDVSGTAQITSRTLVGGTGTPSGTMHVSGTLFLAGDGGQGCDDSTAGIIRRNPTTGRLQVCK